MADQDRRGMLKGAAAVGAFAVAGSAAAQVRSDQAPKELDGKPVPEAPAERSAGPIRPGRGSMLQDKVVVVTGAARGIGRAIAVEMAANGADVVAVDIAGNGFAGIERRSGHAGRARRNRPDDQVVRPQRRRHQGRHPRHRRAAPDRRPGRAATTARSTSSWRTRRSSAGCRFWRWRTPTGATSSTTI